MNKNFIKNNAGFTLIETIIYIFLFAIIIGGGMVSTYNIIESVNASHNHVILQEEANFLFRKIDYTLTGAEEIGYIDTLVPSNTLTVSKVLPGDTIATDFVFSLTGGDDLTLQRTDPNSIMPGPEIQSNSNSIKVSNLSFSKSPSVVGVPD